MIYGTSMSISEYCQSDNTFLLTERALSIVPLCSYRLSEPAFQSDFWIVAQKSDSGMAGVRFLIFGNIQEEKCTTVQVQVPQVL